MSVDEAEATLMLVGTWRLTAFEDRADEESEWASFGTDPQGIIIYDPANIISVHLVAPGPPPSAIGYVGYWGTYRVTQATRASDGFAGIVEHRMEGGFPVELFEEGEERPFELAGDRLRLGDGRTTRRLLERVHSF
jgi:hypothetical protein